MLSLTNLFVTKSPKTVGKFEIDHHRCGIVNTPSEIELYIIIVYRYDVRMENYK